MSSLKLKIYFFYKFYEFELLENKNILINIKQFSF